jgi:hypothetical protein
VLFLARQHIALRKLPFVAKLVHSFGSTTFTLGQQYVGKDAAREFLMNLAHVLRTWMNEQMRKSPTIGIMIDESTDIRVGPRHGANSGGGNEPRFRPAGEVKNIVYENRGVFNKYYLL